MNSIKKNLIYNWIQQFVNIIFPLITIPYLARILGAEGQGIYSYTWAITRMFGLLGMLGIMEYGNRKMAQKRNNKEELSKNFWEIYSIQIVASIIAILLFVFYIIIDNSNYSVLYILQLIYIVSIMFDISWLLQGIEKFKLITFTNVIIKMASTCAIFICVKSINDLPQYIIIMKVSYLICNIILWLYAKKHITYIRPKFENIKKHIRSCIILFIPIIAINIYNAIEKIMLGNFINMKEVGYYENSERIVTALATAMVSLGTVMLPRISNLIANNEKEIAEKYLEKSIKFILFICIPCCLGIICVANNFSILFFGENFIQTGLILQYMSFVVLFSALENVIITQILLPNEKDKEYIKSMVLGAVISVVSSLLLIPSLKSTGATISFVLTHIGILSYQIFISREQINICKFIKHFINILTKSIIMFVVIKMIEFFTTTKAILLVLQIILGLVVYCLLNIKYIKNI